MKWLPRRDNPELDFERIQLLFTSVKGGFVGVAAAILMLYFTVRAYSTSESFAYWWLLAVALANLPRVTLTMLFTREMSAGRITPQNIVPWDYYLLLTSTLAYCGFASAMFLISGENVVIGQLLCAFVYMLLATGGVLVLSTSFTQMFTFLTIVIAAIIINFVRLEDRVFYEISALLVFGYTQLLIITWRQNRTLVSNIALKIAHNQSSLIDPLTRLGNRRRLSLHVEKLLPLAQRTAEPFSLIILDLDHFKEYNDAYGHGAGDELLIHVAEILQDCSRDQDLVVRYGGEEFLMVLSNTDLDAAAGIAERIRRKIKSETRVTVSAGLATYENSLSFDELLTRADAALYSAKTSGRDRCTPASPDVEPMPRQASIA